MFINKTVHLNTSVSFSAHAFILTSGTAGTAVHAVFGRTCLRPLGVNLAGVDGGVRVGASHVDVIRLHDLGDLVVDAQDGLAFLVGLRQRGFELVVGCDQSLHRKHTCFENKA